MKQDMMFVHKKEALRVFTNKAYCIIKPKMRALIICMVKKKRRETIDDSLWKMNIRNTIYIVCEGICKWLFNNKCTFVDTAYNPLILRDDTAFISNYPSTLKWQFFHYFINFLAKLKVRTVKSNYILSKFSVTINSEKLKE